jgi:membrane-associated phospholipid phosphatase
VLFAVPAAYALFDLFDAGPRNWRSFLGDYVVVGEAVAWDGALQQIVSHAVRRPRPFMYQAGVYPTERASSDANSSFYSGHTSATFALSTSFAFTYHMRNPRSPWRIAVWAGLLAVATAESMLRVSSGDHFPTDVMVGAVMGSTFGLVIPALHRREIIPGVSSLGLVPSVERDRTTFSLAGRF